jgi:hypothetical protein
MEGDAKPKLIIIIIIDFILQIKFMFFSMVIKFISNLMKLIISIIIIIILNLYSPSFFMFLIPSNKIYCFSLIVIICFSNLLMMMMMMMMIFPLYLVEKINKRKERKITVSCPAGTRT